MSFPANAPNVLKRYGFKRVSHTNLLEQDDHPSYRSRLRAGRNGCGSV